MSERTFLPWKFCGDALAVRLESVAADGVDIPLEEAYSIESGHLGLVGRRLERSLKLAILVTDQSQVLGEAIPEGADPLTDLAVVLRASVQATRVRRLIHCVRSADGSWRGSIEFAAAELSKRIVVEPFAIRATSTGVIQGFAFRKGEQIGDGSILRVDLESAPILPGLGFDGGWLDFSAGTSPPSLRERADLAWFLDLSDPDKPRLWLNSGIAGFRQLLEVPARNGRTAYLRDAMVHSVVQPVLGILANEAMARLAADPDTKREGWVWDIPLCIAEKAGDATGKARLEAWIERWAAGDRVGVIQDLETGIQRHIGLFSGIEKLARAFQAEVP